MNNILYLKGNFGQENKKPMFGSLKIKNPIYVDHLKDLRQQLLELKNFWDKNDLLSGLLVDVNYNRVIPKSNRISGFFSVGRQSSSDSIVGVRFLNNKHVFTHYIEMKVLVDTIKKLNEIINILDKQFGGMITPQDFEKITKKERDVKFGELTKTTFLTMIYDSCFVESFLLPNYTENFENKALISLYDTKTDVVVLMNKLGIRLMPTSVLNSTTILLNKNEYDILKSKAPYLISMGIVDMSEFSSQNYEIKDDSVVTIPDPQNEPTIGVIDKIFYEDVYFTKWVDHVNMLDPDIEDLEIKDYHGNMVTSIIVDGPTINPELDDGCGRFKVRHFSVVAGKRFSSFTLLKQIDEIVKNNKDIKVWNLSLGSSLPVRDNFISPEAAILDEMQYENDVIFVVAGTNNVNNIKNLKLGAPADSINSLVVNSVNSSNEPASYTRRGPVLSFFTKPDVSYYGGDIDKPIHAVTPLGEANVMGTSFAAPWISRKLAYLIHILKFNREVAKALIIDSAAGWENNSASMEIGYGIVPQRIEDIIKCKDNEIKFIFFAKSEKYDTYNYDIPVPVDRDNKFPYVAKATLCYFPACSRNQGVDYTNTEFDIQIGRMAHGKIKPINNNLQSENNQGFILEEDARSYFRKWDNVKRIQEELKKAPRSRSTYENNLWGVSVKTKERLNFPFGKDVYFGVVVTLKEIKGINRIDDFIKQCKARGWIVNEINVTNRIELYNKAEETVRFE